MINLLSSSDFDNGAQQIVNNWQTLLQIEQSEGNETSRQRNWLIYINLLFLGLSFLFSILWRILDLNFSDAPSLFASFLIIFIYSMGLWLAWRTRIWQSALLVGICSLFATTYGYWVMPAFISSLFISVLAINLIFVSIFLSRRMVMLFAVTTLVLFTGLNIFKFTNDLIYSTFRWSYITQYLMGVAVFILTYTLIWLNMEVNKAKTMSAFESEARYRLLFEASPIALWEQDGSAVLAEIEQLREAGVQDFRAYFEQNPSAMFEMMGSVKVKDVNETAVSMYKAKDKAELMDNLDRFVPEESYSFILDSLEAMANREPYFEQEISNLTLNNDKLTVLYRWTIPPDQEEPYSTVITSIVDVTNRKQIEDALKSYSERLRGLHELDLAINVKKSPEEIAAVSLEFISQFMPSWGAEVWAYDEEGQTVSLLAMAFANKEEGERPFYDSPQPVAFMLSEEMQDDMRDNSPYMIDDLLTLRYLPPVLAILRKCGMRSFIQLTLSVRGTPIGFLNIYDTNVDTFTPEYIGVAREFAASLAIALGNIQLFVAENIARNQAEILRRVAADLNSSLDLEPLLKQILDYLEQVLPYDSATIFLEREGFLTIVAQRGIYRELSQVLIGLRDEELAVLESYNLGQPRLIPDTKADPNWKAYPGFEYIRCWLAIPLQVKGKTIGVLTLDSAVARFYTEKNQEIVLAFANQAAVAIENARLYQRSLQYAEDLEVRVDERTRDLSTLYEITAVASTYLELKKILDESLGILLKTLDCGSGTIFIKDDDGSFDLKSHKGVPDHLLPIVSAFEYEDGVIRKIIDDPQPLFVRDLATSPSLKPLNLPLGKFSYAGVSIRVKNDVIGILSVVHIEGKQFSPEDVALLSSVADQLGVVIENGRLHQQNQEMAVLQERERLARELHDSVTQSLYSLMLFAEASREHSKSGHSEKLQQVLGDIGTTAQQALKEMRLMLYELRTSTLREEGLANALRYRLEAVEGRSGIDAHLAVSLDVDLPPELHRTLYLIAQEALNNTLKHAKATNVFVTLGTQGRQLIMSIEDNGRGFSDRNSRTGGMGLHIMQERIEAVGGNFNINSLPEIGTKIELSVDLDNLHYLDK